ncbi:hypothetical protein Fcan01_00897 [Folsomia candida]|uniref:Uncharacterized protein n=1 Tax=Folsomia candida TaxID=158441 RepID=A0A226F611_FOLCA|nr:hypothetical protein Fcan01_00897 [Folsomia candida]
MSQHKLIQFFLCSILYYFATPIQPNCLMEHQILTKSKSLDDLKIDSNCPRRTTLFQTGHKIQLTCIRQNRFNRDIVIIFPTQTFSLNLHSLDHVETLIPNLAVAVNLGDNYEIWIRCQFCGQINIWLTAQTSRHWGRKSPNHLLEIISQMRYVDKISITFTIIGQTTYSSGFKFIDHMFRINFDSNVLPTDSHKKHYYISETFNNDVVYIYCETRVRLSQNLGVAIFFFPFQTPVWIIFALLMVVALIRHQSFWRGFDFVLLLGGIPPRDKWWRGKSVSAVLFFIGFLHLNSLYVCYITSDMTAALLPEQIATNKELFMDLGYRLFLPKEPDGNLDGRIKEYFNQLNDAEEFALHKIPVSKSLFLHEYCPYDGFNSTMQACVILNPNKGTARIFKKFDKITIHNIKSVNDKIHCNVVKEIWGNVWQTWHFSGADATLGLKAFNSLVEIGLIPFCEGVYWAGQMRMNKVNLETKAEEMIKFTPIKLDSNISIVFYEFATHKIPISKSLFIPEYCPHDGFNTTSTCVMLNPDKGTARSFKKFDKITIHNIKRINDPIHCNVVKEIWGNVWQTWHFSGADATLGLKMLNSLWEMGLVPFWEGVYSAGQMRMNKVNVETKAEEMIKFTPIKLHSNISIVFCAFLVFLTGSLTTFGLEVVATYIFNLV